MPFTAVVWNLEQFGSKWGSFPLSELMEQLRGLLVTDLMTEVSANVLVIQELRFSGILYLKQLRKLLGNQSWHYDWLPGA